MNTTFNKSNNYEELDINDITEKNGFNPNEMISYMKEHGLKYNGEDEKNFISWIYFKKNVYWWTW